MTGGTTAVPPAPGAVANNPTSGATLAGLEAALA